MKASTKILSMLLILAMCLSLMSVTAFAEGPIVIIASGDPAPAEETEPAQEPATEPEKDPVKENEEQKPEESLGFTPAENTVAVINIKSDKRVEKASLREAIEAAPEHATITLVKDTELTGSLTLVKDVKLDLKGKTLSFKGGKDAKAAIIAAEDAQISIINGTLKIDESFAAGLLAKKNANISLGAMKVNVKAETKLFAEGEGNVIVMSGRYSQDPSANLAKGYGASLGSNGLYVVTKVGTTEEEEPANQTEEPEEKTEAPQEGEQQDAEPQEGEQQGTEGEQLKTPEESDVKAGEGGEAEIQTETDKAVALGETGYDTLQEAVDAAAADNNVITLKKDLEGQTLNIVGGSDLVIDLGGFTLTLSADAEQSGIAATYKNGTLKGNLKLLGGKISLEKIKLEGTLSIDADIDEAELEISDANVVVDQLSVDLSKEQVSLKISAGEFKDLTVKEGEKLKSGVYGGQYDFTDSTKETVRKGLAAIASSGLVVKENTGFFTLGTPSMKLTNQGGDVVFFDSENANAHRAVFYTKKSNSNGDFNFYLDSDNTWTNAVVSVYDKNGSQVKTLGTGDYSVSGQKLTIAKDADFLASLPAGICSFRFALANGANGSVELYVFPALTLEKDRYVKGSGQAITVSLTDPCKGVLVADTEQDFPDGKAQTIPEGTAYTRSGNAITFTTSYLDSLADKDKEIKKVFGFTYEYGAGVQAIICTVTIAPAPSIDPTEATIKINRDQNFTVKPNVTGVSIDGNAVAVSDYSVKDNTLTIKAGKTQAFKGYAYGTHTLTVNTKDGDVTAKIDLQPSLGYKSSSGNQHTKGGSKTLVYYASDPVVEVRVGNATLAKDTDYKLSDDDHTITFLASFLNAMGGDKEYTVTAVVKADGKTYDVTSTMKILTAGSAGASPKTGDESNIALWAAVLVVSGAAVVALIPKKKKQ